MISLAVKKGDCYFFFLSYFIFLSILVRHFSLPPTGMGTTVGVNCPVVIQLAVRERKLLLSLSCDEGTKQFRQFSRILILLSSLSPSNVASCVCTAAPVQESRGW